MTFLITSSDRHRNTKMILSLCIMIMTTTGIISRSSSSVCFVYGFTSIQQKLSLKSNTKRILLLSSSSSSSTRRRTFAAASSSTTTTTETTETTERSEVPFMTNPRVTKIPVFDEVCDTVGVTLTRFMNEVAILNPEINELTTLFGAIDTACKAMSNLVKRSQLPSSETLGYQGEVNIQGEDQKKLDVITNDLLKRALRFTGRLGVLASEEEDVPVDLVGSADSDAREIVIEEGEKYVAVFDPLDGSSNVDAGIPTGTIIGIYEHDESCAIDFDCMDDDSDCTTEQEAQCLANTLQPGTNLVAAAYCLYSSSTFLALTLGNGVYIFTLDETIGEFVLSKPNIQIPKESNIYSFNEANINYWEQPMQDVVHSWRTGTGKTNKKFSSRYIGSMVGDVHRTLLYGGIFGYPSDNKNLNGKLRLLYEGAPMSFIMEQAGGLSTTGTKRVMEIIPEFVHQRIPIIMGSPINVQEVIDSYTNYNNNENNNDGEDDDGDAES